MGTAVGGVIGGAVGVAGGLQAGAAVAAAIPGVGPVLAVGMLGAAVLGVAGAGVGAAIGTAAETAMGDGVSADELFVYEDALRKGRSVVVAAADDRKMAEAAENTMRRQGAESIEAARKQWWIGLRSAEKEHYQTTGGDFERNEEFYRMGFEMALNARHRCQEYDQVLSELEGTLQRLRLQYPGADVEDPFRRGYERGREHYQALCNKAA
jgi:hypothetical protein